ncbi:hypothetical protein DUI87_10933 [Hirundo rustica rustica]|uniref:Uncharacterized protein n=1 Tax=Hirundo rustica rustica TaxID=333673 RepID=A0A3M0L278_HIRRU|nr:hypothetical protein DUI87_10933 [Hirundo rustica rustica]
MPDHPNSEILNNIYSEFRLSCLRAVRAVWKALACVSIHEMSDNGAEEGSGELINLAGSASLLYMGKPQPRHKLGRKWRSSQDAPKKQDRNLETAVIMQARQRIGESDGTEFELKVMAIA